MNNEEQTKIQCAICEDRFIESALMHCSDNERYYCGDCFEGFTCEDCDNIYSQNGESYTVEGDNRLVCGDCYEHYTACTNCDYQGYEENMHSCDSCSDWFCESCSDDHGCNNDNDNDNDSSRDVDTREIRGEAGRIIQIDRLVGIELEAENGERSDLFNTLHRQCGIEDDGSLSEGTEVQTPPCSQKALEDMVLQTTKAMKNAGFEISGRCGLHVHIDMRDVRNDYKKITALYKSVYAIEEILYAMLEPSRKSNSYCFPLRRKWKITDVNLKMTENQFLEKWYETQDIRHIEANKTSHSPHNRYAGLNLHSIVYQGTIEFRHHTGSLNAEKIINWVNVLLHIVDYAINHFSATNIHRMARLKDNKKLVQAFFQEFSIPQELQDYVLKRIQRHNPNFLKPIKRVRAIEQQYTAPIRTAMEAQLQRELAYRDELRRNGVNY